MTVVAAPLDLIRPHAAVAPLEANVAAMSVLNVPGFRNAILGSQIGKRGSGRLHAPSGALMPHSFVLDENTAVVIGSIGERWHKHYGAMLAWGVLLAITLVLASLLQAVAATALGVPEQTALPAAHMYDSPEFASGTFYATPESCSVPATDGKACIS
jgi:hypothetical protein